MRGLTGTDSVRPTVNMCRQDQISTLAARRRFYLALGGAPNSTELQLPRLRGADNTCKRHHSQPLPAQIFSLLFTLSDRARLCWNALAIEKDDAQPVHDVHISKGVFCPSLDVFFYCLLTSCPHTASKDNGGISYIKYTLFTVNLGAVIWSRSLL